MVPSLKSVPSSSARIRSMPLGSSHPSSRLMITGLGQPCNRGHGGDGPLQPSTGVHSSFFHSRRFVIFVSNDVLIFTGGAYD